MPKAERFKCIAAAYLLLFDGDNVLLLRRYNTGYQDGMYSVPAGHLDGGESLRAAMIREAQEEIGISLAVEDVHFAHVMHRGVAGDSAMDQERIDFFFTARKYEGTPKIMEPHKCNELRWYPLDALPDNTLPYIRSAIEDCAREQPYSELGWQ
jgi:ADP-ribose pyrophosphatase YjhB (NUDIX family)